MTEKECTKCGEIKPLREFYKDKQKPDGYMYWCKICSTLSHKSAEGIKYNLEYKSTPQGKAMVATIMTKYRQDYPERTQANDRVNYAVKTGKLPPVSSLTCSYPGCDKMAEDYHHHMGYDEENWLNVKPYCSLHHHLVE